MRMKILGHSDYITELTEEAIYNAAGQFGKICYLPGMDFKFNKDMNPKDTARGKMIIGSGHHSITEHIWVNIQLEDCPKIITTFLYNMGFYSASEKSARYTNMVVDSNIVEEKRSKWIPIIKSLIEAEYPTMHANLVDKLVLENVAYFLSVFTPTTAIFSMPINMLNYVWEWANSYVLELKLNNDIKHSDFYYKLRYELSELSNCIKETIPMIPGLYDKRNRDMGYIKHKSNIDFDYEYSGKTHYGKSYTDVYSMSFRVASQAIRHRLSKYELFFDVMDKSYYVPKIIQSDDNLVAEWINDMVEVAKEDVPQATLFNVVETGNIDSLISKGKERLCGRAQLEIADLVKDTVSIYESEIDGKYEFKAEHDELLKFFKSGVIMPRCVHEDFECREICFFGAKHGLDRLI